MKNSGAGKNKGLVEDLKHPLRGQKIAFAGKLASMSHKAAGHVVVECGRGGCITRR